MNDFAAALAPKSDQINAQDLLSGDLTITIRSVKVTPGTEQPVSIAFEGSDKVWRPCKTTGRILMAAWGPDTSKYPGRSVQLYLDSEVKWGGMKVGGIRIRAISHIDAELKLALAESKQARKLVTVKPLRAPAPKQDDAPPIDTSAADAALLDRARVQAGYGKAAFTDFWQKLSADSKNIVRAIMPECQALATKADAESETQELDPFGLPPLPDREAAE